ncbi:MAG: hypothetical protein J7L55_05650 [Desulfurococcales archaeon]|nr:hypothetical protein [Desulfurococcales archaeon]
MSIKEKLKNFLSKTGKLVTIIKSVVVAIGIYGSYYVIGYSSIPYPVNYVLVAGVGFFLFMAMYAPQMMGLSRKRYEADIDFVYVLAHMLSVSTSKTSNTNIVHSVSDENLYPKYAQFFKRIYVLVKEYGYDFPKAALIVSEKAGKFKYLNDFLKRYAATVKVGEDTERFIETELRNTMNFYEYVYSRVMDSARTLLGIYSAVMTSAIFVIANLLILSFIFGGNLSIIIISFIASFAALAAVAVTIWLGMPKEVLIIGGKERKKVLELPYLLTLASLAAILWLVVLYIFYIIDIDPYLLIAIAGTLLMIPGGIYRKIEGFVKEIDEDYPVFVRMYGSNLAILPSPLKALEPMIGVLFGKVALAANRLHTLLANNISFATALKEFAKASKSELIRRASTILGDALKYGGNMSKVGLLLSDLSLMINRTRRRRFQVHKTFESTVYALHMTNVLLISFITVLMNMFSQALVQIRTLIPFYPLPGWVVNYLGLSVAVFLTVINAFALTATSGAGKHIFVYYTGLLLLLGGISAYGSMMMVQYMLQPVSNIISQTMKPIP